MDVDRAERAHLSIGEVLALLQEEFPDVTISKIRFLESQGLLDPERTPSGYRKFYDADSSGCGGSSRQQKRPLPAAEGHQGPPATATRRRQPLLERRRSRRRRRRPRRPGDPRPTPVEPAGAGIAVRRRPGRPRRRASADGPPSVPARQRRRARRGAGHRCSTAAPTSTSASPRAELAAAAGIAERDVERPRVASG